MKPAIDPKMPAILLDIRGLAMRSYHSGTDTHPVYDAETGRRVNSASHGAANFFKRVLLPILSRYAPINIVAVSDGGSDLRRMVYPAYKGKRPEIPKTENEQIETLLEGISRILAYLGATLVKVDGREADDVIGALCEAMPDQHKFVYTVDQDLMQLADDNTTLVLFDEIREELRDKVKLAAGEEIIRVPPELVVLYKSLVGDQSDCYGGIKGFGYAKWIELVAQLGLPNLRKLDTAVSQNKPELVNEIYAEHPNLASVRLIHNNFSDWRLMYYLAKLHPESIWGVVGQRFIRPVFTKRLPNPDKLMAALVNLGVDDFMPKFLKFMPTMTLADGKSLDKVFDHMNSHLEDSPIIGADTETYDDLKHPDFQEAVKRRGSEHVDVLSQKLAGASFCYGDNLQHNVYLPVAHKDTDNVSKDYVGAVLEECQSLNKPLAIQNSQFELTVLAENIKDRIFTKPHCTRVLASYFDENLGDMGNDGLKALSWELLRYQQTTYAEVLEAAGAKDMSEVTGEQVLAYGCDDSFTAAHLWVLMRWSLLLEKQWKFYVENHTGPAHLHSEGYRKGVNIDWNVLERLREADRIVMEQGMIQIRKTLEEHCTAQNKEGVDGFIAADIDFTKHSLSKKYQKDTGKDYVSPDRMTALVEEKRLKLLEKSVYQPYTEVLRPYEFKGTKAQLRDITDHLKFETVLTEDSNKGITAWLYSLADHPMTAQQRDFVELLAPAVGKLKKREGEEFSALSKFCTDLMQPTMKSDWTGDELNFDSPNQVQELLYCKLGLPVRRRSKVQRGSDRYMHGFQGSPATNKAAWNAALAEDCPPGDWRRDCLLAIREVKEAATRFELYYTPYPLWKHPQDDCIHPSIKDPGTVTRRPTCKEPNILQVSKGVTREMFIPHFQKERTGTVGKVLFQGKEAPEIFIPKLPKRLILAPDFSGQELRITGSEANDPALIKAYTGGEVYVDQYGVTRRKIADVHSLTTVTFLHRYIQRELGAEAVGHLPLLDTGRVSYEWYQKVRKVEEPEALQEMLAAPYSSPEKLLKALHAARSKMAKPTNFLITYLGTPSTLAENTSMPEEFCSQIMDEVFAAYARIKPWQEESIEFARQHGYVTTAYGTRKHVDEEILSNDRGLRSRQERRAVNQKIQGCAADILHVVETGMVDQEILHRYNAYFLAPVYDEIVLDVPLNDDLPNLINEMAQLMDTTPPGHAIPMMAEFSFGPNWYKQHELGERPHERQVEEGLSKLFLEAA